MSNSHWVLALFAPYLLAASPPRSELQAVPGSRGVRVVEASSAARSEPAGGGVWDLDRNGGAPLRSGERLEYELTLGGAYMGKMELAVGTPRRVDGLEAVPLFGRLRTNAFVSAVRPVEGRYQAMVHPKTLAPVGVRVEARVGDDPRWEHVHFAKGGFRVETHYRVQGREARRAFEAEHPMLEGLSLLYLARQVPLQPGLVACQDLLSTRRMWRVRAEVLGKETVATPVGPKPAYRVHTVFTRIAYPRPTRRPRQVEVDVLLGDIPGRPPLGFEMSQSTYRGRARLVRWKRGRPG